mgnify:CR=1 FL=1
MFNLSFEELKTMGAEITTREIKQQPELWQEVFDYFISKKSEIEEFLKKSSCFFWWKKSKSNFYGSRDFRVYRRNYLCLSSKTR